MYILSPSQMKSIDRRTTGEYGVSGERLVENAAQCVFYELGRVYGPLFEKEVFVFCGKGNNGADGFAIACMLKSAGAIPIVILACDPSDLAGDAKIMFEHLLECGIRAISWAEYKTHSNSLPKEAIIIDALLGTGISGDVKAPFGEIITYINNSGLKVVSVDLPSGINGATGQIQGAAVKADMTVTFCCEKYAHRLYPARELCGKIIVADIGIPNEDVTLENPNVSLFTGSDLDHIIKPRRMNAHKGSCGKLLIGAGSEGMTGAVCMASNAALRAGCGLVSAMVPMCIYQIVASKLTEAMVSALYDNKEGAFSSHGAPVLLKKAENANALLVGCGMSLCDDTIDFMEYIVKNCKVPLIIDADGINAISHNIDILKRKGAPIIITPHSGEMARLCGIKPEEVEKNRIDIAISFAKEHNVTVVLKGPGTITASKQGTAYINTTGNPGMATGGSGDVLSGVISAFVASGIDPYHAAAAGVYVHGLSGDISAQRLSQYGMIAGDIINHLPYALKKYDSREC